MDYTQLNQTQAALQASNQTRSFLIRLSSIVFFVAVLILGRLLRYGLTNFKTIDGLLLFAGALFSLLVPLVDRLVYVFYTRKDEPLSLQIRHLFSERKYFLGLQTLSQRGQEQLRLSTNNVLFLAIWIVLAIFTVSSSTIQLGRGLLLGLGLELLVNIWFDWKRPDYLRKRLFWPIKRLVTDTEMKWVVWVFVGVFILVTVTSV